MSTTQGKTSGDIPKLPKFFIGIVAEFPSCSERTCSAYACENFKQCFPSWKKPAWQEPEPYQSKEQQWRERY